MIEDLDGDVSLREAVRAVEAWQRRGAPGFPLRIAFLRNVTLEPVVPYLQYFCLNENIAASVWMGSAEGYLSDALDPQRGLYAFQPDVVILSIKLEMLYEKFSVSLSLATQAELNKEIQGVLDIVKQVLEALQRQGRRIQVLVHNFETPVFPTGGMADTQNPQGQTAFFRRLNLELLESTQDNPSVHVVDMDLLQSRLGTAKFYDDRYWYAARAPYSREALCRMAQEYLKFLRPLAGQVRKCLVLDADDTLWGGVIGEDGLAGLAMGNDPSGSAFRDFQKAVLALHQRGVQLALCSKNNEADVLDVLDNHPDTLLRRSHFASFHANWKDKVDNLREIASELELGLQSLVFADSDPFEAQNMARRIPEVAVLRLPADPALRPRVLRACGWFDQPVISSLDLRRNEMAQDEKKRRSFRKGNSSLSFERYLRELKMKVSIEEADERSLSRIAQLTQRTNQFHLTLRRFSEADVEASLRDPDRRVRLASARDRFGDYGLVGVLFLRYKGKEAIIEDFCVSCRVLGRGVEQALLEDALKRAGERSCRRVLGPYVQGHKNQPAATFYQAHGFQALQAEAEQPVYTLEGGISRAIFPPFYREIEVFYRR